MTTPPPSPFQLTTPLEDSEYSNAFYTVLGVHDVTIVFLRTKPMIGQELTEANAEGTVHVRPVGTIIMSQSSALALAKQIQDQINAATTKEGGTK